MTCPRRPWRGCVLPAPAAPPPPPPFVSLQWCVTYSQLLVAQMVSGFVNAGAFAPALWPEGICLSICSFSYLSCEISKIPLKCVYVGWGCAYVCAHVVHTPKQSFCGTRLHELSKYILLAPVVLTASKDTWFFMLLQKRIYNSID